jgi:hypothetical protein
MKRMVWLISVIALAGLLTACGMSTLEVGVDTEATMDTAGSEETDAPLQAEPTEEAMPEEAVLEEEPAEEAMPEEEPAEEAMGEAEPDTALGDQIIAALNSRDDAALIAAMHDPFMVALWRSEGFSVSPNDAPQQIYNYLPEGAQVQHITDTFPTLDGIDPTQMFGPDVAVEDVLYTTGWGDDGSGEALIFIARDANDELYWHGLVVAPGAFD